MNTHLQKDLELAKFFQSLGFDSHQIMVAMMQVESGGSLGKSLYEAIDFKSKLQKEKESAQVT